MFVVACIWFHVCHLFERKFHLPTLNAMASKPSRHKSTCSEWSQWISNCESSPVFCEKIDNVFFFCQIPKSESIWCLILNSDFCVVVAVEQKRKENWFYAFLLCSEQPIYLSCIVLSLLRLICVPFMMKHTEKKKMFRRDEMCSKRVVHIRFGCWIYLFRFCLVLDRNQVSVEQR